MSAIILPRISRVRLTGFAPLFDKTVEFKIPEDPGSFLILGGNGLGKTTILQSIIFAIAGIADRDQQDAREDSRFKWDMSYFKDRLKDPKSAEVIVEFSLGKKNIEVRRGLNNEQIRGVRVGMTSRSILHKHLKFLVKQFFQIAIVVHYEISVISASTLLFT